MARVARIAVPGIPHHVTQRGNRRQPIFVEPEDYALYRDLLAERCKANGVARWAYCPMPNHVHLILTPATTEGLSRPVSVAPALESVGHFADRNAGRETFHVEGREPFRLPPHDPTLYFVQRLRDEAHRFAIGTHRARRKKEFAKNPLDEIAGVGPARKRALLLAFGSAKAVAGAALSDLEKVQGVNKATARLVFDHFHADGN
jgi:hypothetical protein